MSDAHARIRKAARDVRSLSSEERTAGLADLEREENALRDTVARAFERIKQIRVERELYQLADVLETIEAAEAIVADEAGLPTLDERTDPTGRKTRILALLAGGEKSPQQLHRALGQTGDDVRLEAVQTTVKRLVNQGYVKRNGYARYALAQAPEDA